MLVNLALKHACAVPEVSRQVASIAQTSRQALQPAGPGKTLDSQRRPRRTQNRFHVSHCEALASSMVLGQGCVVGVVPPMSSFARQRRVAGGTRTASVCFANVFHFTPLRRDLPGRNLNMGAASW